VDVDGVTVVSSKAAALRALKELYRLRDRAHAWDTESAGLALSSRDAPSPVTRGRVICATCFCGEDADFGNGPRLFIDNDGDHGMLGFFKEYFEDAGFQKVFHNYSFDRHLLARHGIHVRGLHADTLHLARLFDTSLAAWEGAGQARAAASSASAAGREKPAAPRSGESRAVLAVRLGKKRLAVSGRTPKVPVEAISGSRTVVADKDVPTQTVARTVGYGLKSLAAHFNLCDKQPKDFVQLFGGHEEASLQAHNSLVEFPRWVEYATMDAVLTYRLFQLLKSELCQRPWESPVHQRPIEDILTDRNLAENLVKLRGQKHGNLAAQYDTGLTMWDLFNTYLRDFAECLADLEEAGIAVDCSELHRIEAEATKDAESCRGQFVRSFGGLKDPDGKPLNPDAGFINTRSSKQLQTLLFGGSSNRLSGEALPDAAQFPAPRHCAHERDGAAPARSQRKNRFQLSSLGLEPTQKRKNFTESGLPSTSSHILRELAGDLASDGTSGEAYAQLLRRGWSPEDAISVSQGLLQLSATRRIQSLVSGFVQPLLQYGSLTGRIHPSWAFDTATGRLACRRPNLQNLPSSLVDKYKVRGVFQAAPTHAFIVADYSQLEMRVLAHSTNCPKMIDNLTRGGDYHSEVAAEIFPHVAEAVRKGQVAIDESVQPQAKRHRKSIWSKRDQMQKPDAAGAEMGPKPTVKSKFARERSQAKAVNFSIVFGKEAQSLGEDLGIETRQAEELINKWYSKKPVVKRWKEQMLRESRAHGRALSLLGRWRTLPFIASQENWHLRTRSERAAVNFGIQGSAADIVLSAMLRLWRSSQLKQLGFRMVLQVHDEFVLEGPRANAKEALKIVCQCMEKPFAESSPDFIFRVPLAVDATIVKKLSDAK